MSGEHPSQPVRFEFADELEAMQTDPVGILEALKSGLELPDLTVRLGLTHEMATTLPENLSRPTVKTIDTLGKLTILFSRHGVATPPEQGRWLIRRNPYTWIKDNQVEPLNMLQYNAQAEGPRKENVWRVWNAARAFFLRPTVQGINEAWSVVLSGTGEFDIRID